MTEQTPTLETLSKQLAEADDVAENLGDHILLLDKYIRLADKHIALLEARLRSSSADHIADQQRMGLVR